MGLKDLLPKRMPVAGTVSYSYDPRTHSAQSVLSFQIIREHSQEFLPDLCDFQEEAEVYTLVKIRLREYMGILIFPLRISLTCCDLISTRESLKAGSFGRQDCGGLIIIVCLILRAIILIVGLLIYKLLKGLVRRRGT
jgi:hypothetical protein